MKQYLFSYGTLLPGFTPRPVAPIVRRLRPVGDGFVRGFLYHLGAYPGAVLRGNGSRIHGRVFALPENPKIMRRLDTYEDFDPAHSGASEFVRKRCVVVLATGKCLRAWIYAYNRRPGTAPRIADGDFARLRSCTPGDTRTRN